MTDEYMKPLPGVFDPPRGQRGVLRNRAGAVLRAVAIVLGVLFAIGAIYGLLFEDRPFAPEWERCMESAVADGATEEQAIHGCE